MLLTVSSEFEEAEEEIARWRVRQSLGFLFYLSQKHRIERRGWTYFLGVQRIPVALAPGRLTQADRGLKAGPALERETGHGSSVLHLTCFFYFLYYTNFPWFGAKSRQPLRQARYGAVCADAQIRIMACLPM